MNGSRMNQLVAPTSFITETSRRRAKMAMRMVFKMSTAADSKQHQRHPHEDPLQDGDHLLHGVDRWIGAVTLIHARLALEAA